MRFVRKVAPRALVSAAAATTTAVVLASSAQAAVAPVTDVPQNLPTFNGGVYASVYLGNTIYVGGSFTSVTAAGKATARAGLAAINAQTGALLSWAPTTDAKVTALAADPATQTVYIGGDFTHISGTERDGLAAVSATSGALTSFSHTVSGEPRSLSVGHGRLYLGGGHITAIDGQTRANLAAFTLSTGALDTGWAPTADDTILTVVSDTNRIYVGGKFHKISGSGPGKLAALNPDTGAVDTTFRPVVPILVRAVAIGPNGVFAAEGGQGGRTISYDPAGVIQWTFTTDGDVQAVAYLNGVVYSGGHFDNACKSPSTGAHGSCLDGSIPRGKLAAEDAVTGALEPWDPQANGIHGVFTMAANPTLGVVEAGGEFTTLKGISRGRFAQF